MPTGLFDQDLHSMSIEGLRELHYISSEIARSTIRETFRPGFAELASSVKAEIDWREAAAVTTIQNG